MSESSVKRQYGTSEKGKENSEWSEKLQAFLETKTYLNQQDGISFLAQGSAHLSS